MTGQRTPEEVAAWTVLRRRGLSVTRAAALIPRLGHPERTAASWRSWEDRAAVSLSQRHDAKRYVVYLDGRPICWGSPSWCATCLGVSAEAMREHTSGRDWGFPAKRVLRAPCELMDGCASGDVRTVQRLVRAAHSERRSQAKRRADGEE